MKTTALLKVLVLILFGSASLASTATPSAPQGPMVPSCRGGCAATVAYTTPNPNNLYTASCGVDNSDYDFGVTVSIVNTSGICMRVLGVCQGTCSFVVTMTASVSFTCAVTGSFWVWGSECGTAWMGYAWNPPCTSPCIVRQVTFNRDCGS